ncbi:MAG: hypothetical protein IJ740_08495 [Ruminococcus sp.]|nr:hypothetical protein [Ruminococcus sp.]
MNAHVDRKARQIAREEYEKIREEIFRDCAADIVAQCLANVLWTMNTSFGWGEKRLRALVEALHETDELQCCPSALHHRFSGLDCEEKIKESFGIDIRREFPAKVEVKA